jgi:hypothetical protein
MSKRALGDDVISNLAADFAAHGAAVLARVRQSDPANYLKFVASCLPKEFSIATTQNPGDMSSADWALVRELFLAIRQAIPDANAQAPGTVLRFVAAAIDAYQPRRVEHKKAKRKIADNE